MSLEISIENFVLDQDNNFEPDEFEFSYNLFVGWGEDIIGRSYILNTCGS